MVETGDTYTVYLDGGTQVTFSEVTLWTVGTKFITFKGKEDVGTSKEHSINISKVVRWKKH